MKRIILFLALLPVCYLAQAKVVSFKYAREVELSQQFSVAVNGKEQSVVATQEPDFCVFDCDAPVKVTVKWNKPASRVDVRPLSLNFSHKFENGVLTLTLKPKDRVVVEFDGDTDKPLFIFANPIDKNKPSANDPSVRYYKAGAVYEVENLNLKSGETLYIEGGAVVRGNIRTKDASDIKIAGSGVFDSRKAFPMAMNLTRCKNIVIRDITLLNSRSWCTYIAGCDNIGIDNYKVIAEFNYWHKRGIENDALDLLSSTNARIAHCLTYCHDDAYCIKTASWLQKGKAGHISYEDCIAWNVRAGNSMEIGHAVTEDIEDVSYKNMYSIHKRNSDKRGYWNSDISIHCASCGTVRNISYENIYLEETDNSTINIGVFTNHSKSYQPYVPGHIENVRMNNIFVLHGNPYGSQFFGYDKDHRVENVVIDNFYVKGKKLSDPDEALFTVTNASVTLAGNTVNAGEITASDHVETYKYSPDIKSSTKYRVFVNGVEQLVYPTYVDAEIKVSEADQVHVCTFGADEKVNVSVEAVGKYPLKAIVRPVGKGYAPQIGNGRVEFTLAPYDRVSVEIDTLFNLNPLLIFVNPFETNKPDKNDPTVKYFPAGHYNEAHKGINMTKDGKKVLYLEGGAVYKGNISAADDSDITICGYGILDNVDAFVRAIMLSNCKNTTIKGVTVLTAMAPGIRNVQNQGITIDNCKSIATYNKKQKVGLDNDVFDFFGSTEATVTRCFAYAHDDLYTIDSKSFKKGWSGEVRNMTFDDCIGWNVRGGNCFNIGFATGDDISDISFRNCYAIHSHMRSGSGRKYYKNAAIAIHSGSLGNIRNVTFENIYVEDNCRRAFTIEMLKSPYDKFPEDINFVPGKVENILFKNFYILQPHPDNEKPIIKGFDANYPAGKIVFDNLQYLGKKVLSPEEAGIETLNCPDVEFK